MTQTTMRTLKETITIRRFDDGTCQMDKDNFRYECRIGEIVSDPRNSYLRIQIQTDPIGMPTPIMSAPNFGENYVRCFLQDGKIRMFRGYNIDELTVNELKAALVEGWQALSSHNHDTPFDEQTCQNSSGPKTE